MVRTETTYFLRVDLSPAAVESGGGDRRISCEANEDWWLGRENGQVAGFSGKFKENGGLSGDTIKDGQDIIAFTRIQSIHCKGKFDLQENEIMLILPDSVCKSWTTTAILFPFSAVKNHPQDSLLL